MEFVLQYLVLLRYFVYLEQFGVYTGITAVLFKGILAGLTNTGTGKILREIISSLWMDIPGPALKAPPIYPTIGLWKCCFNGIWQLI